MDNSDPCVLVEGPEWGDAKFYCDWLLAAGAAQSLWNQALEDQEFRKQIDRVNVYCVHDFGISATFVVMQLRQNKTRFVLHIDSYVEGEAFTMMVGMGFFVKKHQSYQMTVPTCLTGDKVRSAVVAFAETEDNECFLHPECLITAVPFAEASELLHLPT